MVDDRWWNFKYKASDYWTSFTYLWRKPYYKLKLLYRIGKHHYWGPWSISSQLLTGPFETFCLFYESQEPETTYINTDEDVQAERKELIDLYKWYTIEKKQNEENLQALEDFWFSQEEQFPLGENIKCGLYLSNLRRYLFDLYWNEMERLRQEEQTYLLRLINIREKLDD